VTPCRSSPIQIPGTQWCRALTGHNFSLALKTDNTLWAWGCNNFGQLGNDQSISGFSSPIQIPGNQWCKIANSFGGLNASSAAIKTDGTFWTWGHNTNGQLGDGTTIHRSSPVQVPGTQWTNLCSGGYNVMAFKCFT
jgi:alpha-tubulin suppressor-like RCC1 family protein